MTRFHTHTHTHHHHWFNHTDGNFCFHSQSRGKTTSRRERKRLKQLKCCRIPWTSWCTRRSTNLFSRTLAKGGKMLNESWDKVLSRGHWQWPDLNYEAQTHFVKAKMSRLTDSGPLWRPPEPVRGSFWNDWVKADQPARWSAASTAENTAESGITDCYFAHYTITVWLILALQH